ncbi:MAG TPA: hypothetical protein VIV15_05580 [Anaerolineales bacterium]
MNRLLPANPNELEELSPGIRGYTMERDGALYIPLVIATERGTGAMKRYFDVLMASGRTVKFPNVVSEQLRGMLERRGFRLTVERDDLFGEEVDVWVYP